MQLFAQAIDENQFAQAAQNEQNEKRDKNKNKKTENGTTTNWPLGKLSLKPGCRYYFNGKQTYFNFNASQGGERFEKKGQQASEMLNQIKVPATQMQNKTKKEQKQKQYHSNWSRGSGKWGSPRPEWDS